MCGIVAIYAYHSDAPPVDPEELIRIRDAMRHRGPDGAGLWLSENCSVGLAHRRLSIIDLSDIAAQPMTTEDGQYSIVFNGEIYNYLFLRQELEARGCHFRSNSDTEVLLRLYVERGPEMVHVLRGMFSFAIWDNVKRGLFLARDHFGIKPLYIHDDGKTFRCASQVRALLAGHGFDQKIEPAGHVGFFLWGSVPEPFTLYKGLMALPAGHMLWVDNNGHGVPQCYFDVADELVHTASHQRVYSQRLTSHKVLQHALRDTVKHHLVADVPVGVFLSAGIDSGTITALASEQASHINAVTLGFREYKDTEQDEVPLACKVAQQYGCEHHIIYITRKDFEQEISLILAAMDQPTIDGVNTYFVARAASNIGLKVVLSGLGGDELLGGYSGFSQIPLLVLFTRPFSLIPGFGKTFRIVTAPFLKRMTSPKYASLFEYGTSYGGAYLLRRALFMPWELPDILDSDMVREGWESLQPVLSIDNIVDHLPTSHAKISAIELTHYMRNTLLRDSDWAGMAHSLEIRVPLVDVVLFRALAPYLVNADLPSKRNMALTPINPLPDEVVNRAKTGFSIPVQEWIESSGQSKRTRGLRGWAALVYQKLVGK
jgi:asparagine synthase (glutamine-hydrolysing)